MARRVKIQPHCGHKEITGHVPKNQVPLQVTTQLLIGYTPVVPTAAAQQLLSNRLIKILHRSTRVIWLIRYHPYNRIGCLTLFQKRVL